ncbi:MAG: class I adenylate cyclase, partial [Succinivibrio sp.]
ALGCEVNLFVTTEDRFTNGEHGTMDTEDCGSAQSLFLLDEFYRTSLRLCGRYLAWYIIPEEDEINDYTKAISSFYNSSFVKKDEWFDFGSVAKCSPVEYFGSGLWLVYKGIDHPLKAVLKILLMETYASEYPSTRLLSMQLKEAVMSSSKFSLRHDPYYLMYRKVITYLRDQNDTVRQNLARICFYLKLRNGIIGMPKCKELGFRTRFLRRICRIWGWNLAYSEKIDNVDKWKISSVRPLLHQLLSSLLESYKSLLRFSVEHRIEYAITSDDAGILSRKIYAAYDRYPGKILHVTGDFSHRLEEENLTLIRPSKNSVCQMGWHAYTCVDSSIDLLSQKPVYIAGGIVEMVTWATVSKVISERTNVFIRAKNSSVTEDKVRELSFDIKNFILNASLAVTEADLQKPRRVVRTLLVVNFEKDVTKDFLISASDLEIGSALSCGRQKMCLIGSVDIVNINSWGEISCNSFSYGEDGILDVLASLLNSHEQRSEVENDDSKETFQVNKVNDIRVCCYSNVHKDLIRYDLEAVIRGIFNCKLGYDTRFMFNVGHNEYESRVD